MADAAAGGGHRWTEEVDDLVDAGDVDGAISLLESVVSNLSTAAAASSQPTGAELRLATALGDLAGLHASRGSTLQADTLRSRAIALRLRAAQAPQAFLGDHGKVEKSSPEECATGSKDSEVSANFDEKNEDEDDDWEAIADRGAHEETPVRPLKQEARVTSSSSSEKSSTPSSSGPKRRGRGSFLYDKSVLYSDQCDLERIFEKFGDHGVAIRWVNDSTALAVFRTPSSAKEAQACVPPRYKVRLLKEDDDLLAKIDGRDLEPPMPRPKTSARTAQRLIAHGMGLKQFTKLGAGELKEQEEARRSRITARQAARDDAWGSD
ncbi:hypothetical protein BRADI_2g61727v3 [Brachypodium distachyon]|uniref:RRM domain-containing protein n=1 Tax=Brachypodium distachyon TaxID=15368 RepID=A0A0Q3J174_BRADI|nr:hypothetical protein BRADI_2g61727v3 [Brachypodium distachyon]